MFSNLFSRGKEVMNDLKNGAMKFKGKTFLEAAINGGFMVASADGNVDSNEKSKLLNFMKTNEALSVYDQKEIVEAFNKTRDIFDFDQDAAEATALQSISKMKGDSEKSKFLVRMICAIGRSDGDFDKDEKAVVRKICIELNLNPSEFDV